MFAQLRDVASQLHYLNLSVPFAAHTQHPKRVALISGFVPPSERQPRRARPTG